MASQSARPRASDGSSDEEESRRCGVVDRAEVTLEGSEARSVLRALMVRGICGVSLS